jgi:hypothetical protein
MLPATGHRRPRACARLADGVRVPVAGDGPTRVYTKQELLLEVWSFKAIGNTRTVDAHTWRLCKKVSAHVNVRGVGYRRFAGCVVAEREAVTIPLPRNGRAA